MKQKRAYMEEFSKVHQIKRNIDKPDEALIRKAAVTHFPTPMSHEPNNMKKEEKIEFIASRFAEIMWALGLDLEDSSLYDTPTRVAKMYVNEIFSGLDIENFPSISFFETPNHSDDAGHQESHANMVLVKTYFHSFCEHHFIPMDGEAYIAYIPKDKLIGLSKIPRIVRYLGRRPQVQERLCAQIADCLAILLDTEDVAVTLALEHTCVAARGVEDTQSHTVTNILRGKFETDSTIRKEFFEGVNRRTA
jgi:GTP cyclohydrolase I